VWPPVHLIALFIAFLLVLAVWATACYNVYKHSQAFEAPDLQRHIIAMHFMAPIHATAAWVCIASFVWVPLGAAVSYLILLRDLYMAFTVASLWWFLTDSVGGEKALTARMERSEQAQLLFPLSFLPPWTMGFEMMFNCRLGVMQFVVTMPVLALLRFCAHGLGLSDGTLFSPLDLALCTLAAASAVVGLYCLAQLCTVSWDSLSAALSSPLWKVSVVAAAVWLAFFQGLLVRLVVSMIVLPTKWQIDDSVYVIVGVEQWFVTLEMLVVAIFVNVYYPVDESPRAPLLPKGEGVSTKTFSVFV